LSDLRFLLLKVLQIRKSACWSFEEGRKCRGRGTDVDVFRSLMTWTAESDVEKASLLSHIYSPKVQNTLSGSNSDVGKL
jgi:hypothetical protein